MRHSFIINITTQYPGFRFWPTIPFKIIIIKADGLCMWSSCADHWIKNKDFSAHWSWPSWHVNKTESHFMSVQWRIQDGIPPGCKPRTGFWRPGQIEEWRPRRRCWMGEGGSMLEVIISFSDNVIGIRLFKIALTLIWLVLNVRASSTRKFEMLSEKWGAHYSVILLSNFGNHC